ncbi:hypothetical protein CALCODRAFT_509443 [Calocera cornea HHB12733]|uniref:F-box domain-containing protein n=1 Tax=Calocera cornea HHB12733 TaxID=1353952 RepID=A0A165FAE3_9BASI|nr:hypothetical protein CALCODRAFT_509443 [Calocera cornea HHB12733]
MFKGSCLLSARGPPRRAGTWKRSSSQTAILALSGFMKKTSAAHIRANISSRDFSICVRSTFIMDDVEESPKSQTQPKYYHHVNMTAPIDGFSPALRRDPQELALNIPELMSAFAQQLDDNASLVSLACTCKRFTDICLTWLWYEPAFTGSPLMEMLYLFPEEVHKSLDDSQNPNLKIPVAVFERFDYYMKFIRSINLWHHGREGYVARILTTSRPGVWLFPALIELHLGASGEELETVLAYLTPTLRKLWLNHWDGRGGREIQPNPALKKTLSHVCRLSNLAALDMADTLYTPLEDDSDIVQGFIRLASQLSDFRCQSFLTLRSVFNALSLNPKLSSVFLNTITEGEMYVPLPDLIEGLREQFEALTTLGLYCTMEQAVAVFTHLRRSIPHVNLKISTAIAASDLHTVISSIYSVDHIQSLRVSSAGNLEDDDIEPPIRISEVIAPLSGCQLLQKLELILSFTGEQMMRDDEIAQFFQAWPKLSLCTILNEAEGELETLEGEETSFGLSLRAVLAAARYCPCLTELTIPFVDTNDIPDVGDVPRYDHALALQLCSTHVHNLTEVADFVRRLWSSGDISTNGCEHSPAARVTV